MTKVSEHLSFYITVLYLIVALIQQTSLASHRITATASLHKIARQLHKKTGNLRQTSTAEWPETEQRIGDRHTQRRCHLQITLKKYKV